MKTALAAVAALTLSATAASASWTGCRVGLGGTVQGSNTELSAADTVGAGITAGLDGFGTQDVGVSIAAGCDVQLGSIVLGAMADYTFGENEWKAGLGIPAGLLGPGGISATATAGFENVYTIGARAGFTVTPTTLVSVHGGYAAASTNDLVVANNGAEIFRASMDDLKGWFIGGAIESQITPNVIIGLSYKYIQFDSVDLPLDPRIKVDLETEVNQVMATLSYRFGASDVLSPMK